jgi:hypothetical protein
MSNHEGRRRSTAGSQRHPVGPEALKAEAAAGAPRAFTISEVNALIPTLSFLVMQQLRDQSEIEQGLAELTRWLGETPLSLEVRPGDAPEMRRLKLDLRRRVVAYEAGWNKVRELGGIVKDPQIGLVDFYGRIDGRMVWLCWRYGEDTLGYYHELDSGYSGRRPLSADVRRSLLN